MKSIFEKARQGAKRISFEIPVEGDACRGPIFANLTAHTLQAYSAETDGLLHIVQEKSCGCIYLNQEQGVILARQLSKLFLTK